MSVAHIISAEFIRVFKETINMHIFVIVFLWESLLFPLGKICVAVFLFFLVQLLYINKFVHWFNIIHMQVIFLKRLGGKYASNNLLLSWISHRWQYLGKCENNLLSIYLPKSWDFFKKSIYWSQSFGLLLNQFFFKQIGFEPERPNKSWRGAKEKRVPLA